MELITKLLGTFGSLAAVLTDKRQGTGRVLYSMSDIFLSAFSLFFMQNASFLSFQRNMEKGSTQTNYQGLFGVEKIPTDSHIRSMLDAVSPGELEPCFDASLAAMEQNGGMASFTVFGTRKLIALDGTEYFGSHKLNCPCCQKRERSNGKTEYYHAMLCATVVAPGHNQAFPLMPEFITPQDGHDKQDCELAAAKRWLAAHHDKVKALQPIYLGDALFACQSLCEAIRALQSDFLFTSKPGRNKGLYELVNGMQRQQVRTKTQPRGKRPVATLYEWIDDVPLRHGDEAQRVTWIRISTTDHSGKKIYSNDFITSLSVSKETIVEIVACARARWKIENETFNVLKNNGYHIEHNFGHGQKNLAMVFAAINLLAFACHTVMDCCSKIWNRVRDYEGSRKDFFGAMSNACRFLIFPSWESLWGTMLDKNKTPDQKQFQKISAM